MPVVRLHTVSCRPHVKKKKKNVATAIHFFFYTSMCMFFRVHCIQTAVQSVSTRFWPLLFFSSSFFLVFESGWEVGRKARKKSTVGSLDNASFSFDLRRGWLS